jgi:hypothetical protein
MTDNTNSWHSITTWNPEPNQSISGTLVNSATATSNGGIQLKYKLKTDDGSFIYVSGTRMLNNLMSHVHIGDSVSITYDGMAAPEWGGKYPYKHFTVFKNAGCPTCGNTHWMREVLPQRIKSPKYVNSHEDQATKDN